MLFMDVYECIVFLNLCASCCYELRLSVLNKKYLFTYLFSVDA